MNAHDSFIAAMLPTARRFEKKYGFAAEGLVAINISETNYGAAGSFFGIKGTGSAGSIDYTTWENYGPGQEHTIINDQFAAYKSLDDAYQAFFDFIQIGRYIPAWTRFQQDHDWRELVHGINVAGYATDPHWWNLILNLSGDVRRSEAWTITEEVGVDGWRVEGQQIIGKVGGFDVIAIGDPEGEGFGRIAKLFGDKWYWLRMGEEYSEGAQGDRVAYWSPEEGD